jgi:putative copper export protein
VELVAPGGVRLRGLRLRPNPSDPAALLIELPAELPSGAHTVEWRTAGTDGHPVAGSFGFTIVSDSEDTATPITHHDPVTFPERRAFGASSPVYAAVRWVTFVALLGTIGTWTFIALVLGLVRRRGGGSSAVVQPALDRAGRLARPLGLLLVVALIARLFAQTVALFGLGSAADPARLGALLTGTLWGAGWTIQALATMVVIAGFGLVRGGPRTPSTQTPPGRPYPGAGWVLVGIGALALAFTPALSGHAAAVTPRTSTAIFADTLHVLGAGGWIGGLVILLVVGMPAVLELPREDRPAAAHGLVGAFSAWAPLFAGAVVLTGAFAAVIHVGSIDGLLGSDYGTLLLAKLAGVAVLLGLGGYHARWGQRALTSDGGIRAFRRTGTAEALVGIVVIVLTSILVALPPPSPY